MCIVEVTKQHLVKYSNLTKTSVNREVSEKSRKFNSNWSKPQSLVRLQVISAPKELLFKEALQHQSTRKHTGNSHGRI